jgi:hypothetical protein
MQTFRRLHQYALAKLDIELAGSVWIVDNEAFLLFGNIPLVTSKRGGLVSFVFAHAFMGRVGHDNIRRRLNGVAVD